MVVFQNIAKLQSHLSLINKTKKIGFIPTMGALHEGHMSLIERGKKKCDYVVVSIFVNPTQFDNSEDLVKYPRTLENDLKMLESIGCDAVFTPTSNEIYGSNIEAQTFHFDGLEHQMEGAFREGHFDGVGTIVKKLFEIVKPNVAFFGEKDFQQLQIIKRLVEKHEIPVKIVGCKIHREEDGLAMSSRNTRLTPEHRKEAPFIYKTLKKAKKRFKKESIDDVLNWVAKRFEKNELLELEYFTIADEKTLESAKEKVKGEKYRGFIAVFAGKIRLIDNIKL